jgi:hypothetical protein
MDISYVSTYQAVKEYRRRGVSAHSRLHHGKLLGSCSGRVTPREVAPCTKLLMRLYTSLGWSRSGTKRKILSLCLCQPQLSRLHSATWLSELSPFNTYYLLLI